MYFVKCRILGHY